MSIRAGTSSWLRMRCLEIGLSPRSCSYALGLLAVLMVLNTWYYLQVGCSETIVKAETSLNSSHVSPPEINRSDCGPACLFLACNAAGRPKTIAELRSLTEASERGTSMMMLKRAAVDCGFVVAAKRLSAVDLLNALNDKPFNYAILYLPKGHFVFALPSRQGQLGIIDPARGSEMVDVDVLGSERFNWKGEVLLLGLDGKGRQNAG